eukprot:CAMPEP_0170542834 /NCGR_PEP_ID=MMETSP0211-20121228/2142_1 /TAXON_ID=311385 /ORGANISM="Pseudokeronopsis sp., Strain OXSARD2" /LENGTH=35 /DNA_ID= /DNA_START= /DNA_END= /DNA_ORIENTATION=
MPSGEREVIEDYQMQFIDRNAMNKAAEIALDPDEE